MKIAYFDCQFGAAGDMLLGALIDSGMPEETLVSELNKLALPKESFSLVVTDTSRCSIASKKVKVTSYKESEDRNLSEITEIIEKSAISENTKDLSKRIFKRLAEAEATVHGLEIDKVHFHEVGAIDAIIDIVGFAIAYEYMGIQKSYVSPLPLGMGTVKTEHGIFPVPGPAVVALIQEARAPVRASEIAYECLTPTGAAILTTVASEWGRSPKMAEILTSGYGAGTIDSTEWPNVCRLIIGITEANGKLASDRFERDQIIVIEANLDDLSPQILAYTTERLFCMHALDVCVLPIVMKKGRSGHLLSALCKPEDQSAIEELILSETSTLGVRSYMANRVFAQREWHTISLSNGGEVKIKIARDRLGQIVNVQPEYSDCVDYATAHGVPLKEVLTEAATRFYLKENATSQIARPNNEVKHTKCK